MRIGPSLETVAKAPQGGGRDGMVAVVWAITDVDTTAVITIADSQANNHEAPRTAVILEHATTKSATEFGHRHYQVSHWRSDLKLYPIERPSP